MKVAFVSGPYRAPTVQGIVQNIREAETVALGLWQFGFAAICPHKNTGLLDGAAPDEVWLRGDLEILRRCDLVVMLPRWEKSEGATKERDRALELGIPVFDWPHDFRALARLANDGTETTNA